MHVDIEELKGNWHEITVQISKNEIDLLIALLNHLKNDEQQHFHLASNYEGDGGVGDIEFSVKGEEIDNMMIVGFAISPNR